MFRGTAKSMASLAARSSRFPSSRSVLNSVYSPIICRSNVRCFSAPSDQGGSAGDAIIRVVQSSISSPTQTGTAIDPSSIIEGLAQIDTTAAQLGNSPSHYVMQGIDQLHLLTGLPYWESIIVITVSLRLLLFPLSVKSAINSAEMAGVRPLMAAIKARQAKHPRGEDPSIKAKFEAESKKVFVDHKISPLKALVMPIVQLPLFLFFYFGLRDMGTYFPGYATGGDFWFTDLSAADPYYIFPIVNAVSFLLMIEFGSDGVPTENTYMFKWGMRGLACCIGPLTYMTPQGVFIYWTANNMISVVQAQAFKTDSIRKVLGIPAMPKEENAPPLKLVNPFRSVMKAVKQEVFANTSPEAVRVDQPAVVELVKPKGPPPVTYAAPPRLKKKMKK